jgi:hypothetical protein
MHHFNIGSFIYTLDHVPSEPKELMEQAQAKATNPELAQASPGASLQNLGLLL